MSRRLNKHSEKILSAVADVLKSEHLILGEHVEKFEKNFSDYVGVKYCIGVANGTDAIELALRSLELAIGSTVGIAANAGGYSRIAIEASGYKAVYEDVDEESHCLSLETVSKLIKAGVSAVIVTHLYGRVAPDSFEIAAACKAAGVFLIEDCAQAHGAHLNHHLAGNFGDLASFSFYPTKNLGGLGDAGAVTTNNFELAARVRSLRTYGWSEKYEVSYKGGRNSRIDAIQAALLNSLLPYLEAENDERRTISRTVGSSLDSPYIRLLNVNDDGCNFHLMVIRTKFRSDLINHLNSLNIGSSIHYPVPDHLQILWKEEVPPDLPVTKTVSAEILSIPCFPGMNEDEITRVIEALNSFKSN
jgi:dTDP-4-amino-4,6-dideoxygalactose transaminase